MKNTSCCDNIMSQYCENIMTTTHHDFFLVLASFTKNLKQNQSLHVTFCL